MRAAMARFPWATTTDALLAAALLCACALIAALVPTAGDYSGELSPAMHALLRGDLGAFATVAPVYGASALPRLPFAAAADALGGGELAVFRAGAFACMTAVAALAWWISRTLRATDRPRLQQAVIVAILILSPVLLRTLRDGHPEDILAATLAIGATLAAARGRTVPAGLALGLAITAKPWAVIAVAPVVLAAPGRRLLLLTCCGTAAAATYLPILLLAHDPGKGSSHYAAVTSTGRLFHPQQLFWPLRESHDLGAGITAYTGPLWLSTIAHPAIVAFGGGLSLLWATRRRRTGAVPDDALLLLATCLLFRALLDPWNLAYYALPAVLALAIWEALRRDGLPLLALSLTALTWLSFVRLPRYLEWDALAWTYLVWAVPLALMLVLRLTAPAALVPLRRWIARDRQPSSSATAARTSPSVT